jgi:predicted kinase
MSAILTIFSGLPGTGKTSLARRAASQLRIPLLGIDDIVSFIPQAMLQQANPFWETLIGIMLSVAEAQLEIGVSVVIDSVFMGEDRLLARQIAARHQAEFRPIYTYVSDETIWRERVERRAAAAAPEAGVATWERIQEQRTFFHPWKPASALFVDAIAPLDENFAKVTQFITAKQINLDEL